MKLSAEITIYPFQSDFIPIVKATIDKLNTFNKVSIKTFPTASILLGKHTDVMEAINDTMLWSHEKYGQCVFIVKFLPGYEAY